MINLWQHERKKATNISESPHRIMDFLYTVAAESIYSQIQLDLKRNSGATAGIHVELQISTGFWPPKIVSALKGALTRRDKTKTPGRIFKE